MGGSVSRNTQEASPLKMTSAVLEEFWAETFGRRQFVPASNAVAFLEALGKRAGVKQFSREQAERWVEATACGGAGEVAHDDLENLIFLHMDLVSEEAMHADLSTSLQHRFEDLALPHLSIKLDEFERGETISLGQGVETYKAVRKTTGERCVFRVHSLSFVRKEVDISAVLEQMRRLHCASALKYVGSAFETKDILVIVYEEPEADLICLGNYLKLHSGPMNSDLVRAVFLRLARGLAWLEKRKNYCHLQLRMENVYLSPRTKRGYLIVGESLLLRRFDMVNVELLAPVVSYCSPELLSGDPDVSSPADVFAVGMLMYAALTNSPLPFGAEKEAPEIAELILSGARPHLQGLPGIEGSIQFTARARRLDKAGL